MFNRPKIRKISNLEKFKPKGIMKIDEETSVEVDQVSTSINSELKTVNRE